MSSWTLRIVFPWTRAFIDFTRHMQRIQISLAFVMQFLFGK